MDDPYDSNELGLEELLGIEDVDEIGTFLEKGVKFTEDNGGIRAQNCERSIVDRAIKLRAIACAKIQRLDNLRKGLTSAPPEGQKSI